MEIRSYGGEEAKPQLVGERTIEGYAVVFERESRVIYDPKLKKRFVEVIRRGAITEDDFRRWDIKALTEHNRERLLARRNMGTGSLTLTVDDYGVKYRFDAPMTQEGDYVVEMVKRGDLFGSSFAYSTNDAANTVYSKRTDAPNKQVMLLREVRKIDRMYDVSIVADPAYSGTDVTVRSLEDIEKSFDVPEVMDETYKESLSLLRSMI